ncbi:hypothetical protein FHT40_005557 [Mycolicibacterium sp. BK556]|uniref:hypothetical protein n=1 Tax=Mycobacteriaceae TaxID=1762 RepID=UPI001060B5C6|nr:MULTISPECIES: hypothetical protein [Mycobacteriaceae]MBB3605870.1 hypothetical protein [Mycolicibacterium sp. BK556]MBB3635633.1 hypothetical protein [Mycolicibacterium sp. BK607]MBB3753051.1 hypothetical protein [Mycolicibacterium sp. BK634]TDO09184.1 hypothetical protein EV580_5218 [Mycobacterium sp. BK086]
MRNIKTLSAVVGGSAIVAMGALAMGATEPGGSMIMSDPGTFTSPVPVEMTTGETTKSEVGEPTVTAVSYAPPVTAEPPEAP